MRASSGEEERYSHSDLNGFAANLTVSRKVLDLLRRIDLNQVGLVTGKPA